MHHTEPVILYKVVSIQPLQVAYYVVDVIVFASAADDSGSKI